MAKSQELENFGHMVEKIIFDDDELERLKIAIKNFTEGKISAKDLKHLILQCRGRMVEEMTDFGFFFAKKKTAALTQVIKNTQQTSSTNKVELTELDQEEMEVLLYELTGGAERFYTPIIESYEDRIEDLAPFFE